MHAQAQGHTALTTCSTVVQCPTERSDASRIAAKHAVSANEPDQPGGQPKIPDCLAPARYNIRSNPFHLAHQDKIELTLNGKALFIGKTGDS